MTDEPEEPIPTNGETPNEEESFPQVTITVTPNGFATSIDQRINPITLAGIASQIMWMAELSYHQQIVAQAQAQQSPLTSIDGAPLNRAQRRHGN